MKKVILPLVVILTCFIGYYIIYNEEFMISDSTEEIETALNNWIGKTSKHLAPAKVDNLIQVENSNMWISTLTLPNDDHGYVLLKKGWNNRYRFDGMGTRPDLSDLDLETNKGLYVAVIGQNQDLTINKLIVTINGMNQKEYEYDISNEKKFIKLIKIPKEYEYRTWTTFQKFDANNNEL